MTATELRIGAIVLAAGLSSRMGRPKMLLPWGDNTVIQTVVTTLQKSRIEEIIIVTGAVHAEIREKFAGLPVRLVFNPLYANGEMLHSLQRGLAALGSEIEAAFVVLGDQPQIQADTVTALLAESQKVPSALIIPSYQMRRGHPWLVRRDLWDELCALQPPLTLRDFLRDHSADIHYLNVDTPTILADLDTPEDYRKNQSGAGLPNVWKLPANDQILVPVTVFESARTLDQVSSILPQGVYTTFRTYHQTYTFRLEDHIQRLVSSAERLGKPVVVDERGIRAAIRQSLQFVPAQEYKVRLTIDLEKERGATYIQLEKLTLPTEANYRDGVATLARPFQRQTPESKSTGFIAQSAAYRELISGQVNEVLLFTPQRLILEGLSSNFYAIRDNKIHTAGEGILAGITRAMVLEEAGRNQIEVEYRPISLDEIDSLKEAFITSSSRAVLPVAQIEAARIGPGLPGPITQKLGVAYQARVERDLEKI